MATSGYLPSSEDVAATTAARDARSSGCSAADRCATSETETAPPSSRPASRDDPSRREARRAPTVQPAGWRTAPARRASAGWRRLSRMSATSGRQEATSRSANRAAASVIASLSVRSASATEARYVGGCAIDTCHRVMSPTRAGTSPRSAPCRTTASPASSASALKAGGPPRPSGSPGTGSAAVACRTPRRRTSPRNSAGASRSARLGADELRQPAPSVQAGDGVVSALPAGEPGVEPARDPGRSPGESAPSEPRRPFNGQVGPVHASTGGAGLT